MMTGRAKQRGKPLDENCYRADISTHEYGMNDERKFCYGLMEMMTEDVLTKCRECGAFVDNATPIDKE